MVKNDIPQAGAPEQGYATGPLANHPTPYMMFDSDSNGLMLHGHNLADAFDIS